MFITIGINCGFEGYDGGMSKRVRALVKKGKNRISTSNHHLDYDAPRGGGFGLIVCEHKMMDVKSTWIFTWHQMDHVSWSLGLLSLIISWR